MFWFLPVLPDGVAERPHQQGGAERSGSVGGTFDFQYDNLTTLVILRVIIQSNNKFAPVIYQELVTLYYAALHRIKTENLFSLFNKLNLCEER